MGRVVPTVIIGFSGKGQTWLSIMKNHCGGIETHSTTIPRREHDSMNDVCAICKPPNPITPTRTTLAKKQITIVSFLKAFLFYRTNKRWSFLCAVLPVARLLQTNGKPIWVCCKPIFRKGTMKIVFGCICFLDVVIEAFVSSCPLWTVKEKWAQCLHAAPTLSLPFFSPTFCSSVLDQQRRPWRTGFEEILLPSNDVDARRSDRKIAELQHRSHRNRGRLNLSDWKGHWTPEIWQREKQWVSSVGGFWIYWNAGRVRRKRWVKQAENLFWTQQQKKP